MRIAIRNSVWTFSGEGLRPAAASHRWLAETIGITIALLLLTTAMVAVLEGTAGIADASPIYLLAVVVVGSRAGTLAALITALVAFLIYDLVFTQPQWSLVVANSEEWLDLLVFLVVAVGIGRLAAIERARTLEADQRAREASSLFAISRLLSTSSSLVEAAPAIARRVVVDASLTRAWITITERGREAVLTDTVSGAAVPAPTVLTTLVRVPGDEPAHWTRTHQAGLARSGTPERRDLSADASSEVLRVPMEVGADRVGAIWAVRERATGLPTREETRILALAADQIALAVRRDQLRREATAAEVARQGDSLKSALLDSVSHDLRTPLASIRAIAGGLADPAVDWTDDDRRASAGRIDDEAARLDRLVRQVLDLGRIGAGTVEPELESIDLVTVIDGVLDRLRGPLGERPCSIDLPDEVPVVADEVILETIVTNLVENVARHAPAPAPMRVATRSASDGWIELTIEDGGPGVPADALAHIFDRFYRVPDTHAGSRPGLGVGLSVVLGLAAAIGGSVAAGPSDLGGLAVRVRLRSGEAPS